MPRRSHLRRFVLGQQLEHRVERVHRDPGRLVQARRVHARHPAGRRGDAVPVEQPVVDCPAVDGHGVQRAGLPGCGAQAIEDPGEQRPGIPAQHAVHQPRVVGEPVDLAERELVTADATCLAQPLASRRRA